MKNRLIISAVSVAIFVILGVAYFRFNNREVPSTTEAPTAIQEVDIATELPGVGAVATTLIGVHREPVVVKSIEPVEPGVTSLAIREIVNLQGNIWSRQKVARALSPELSSLDQQRLLRFLKVPNKEDEGQGGHVLKNDVMDALVAQKSILPEISSSLTAIYRDPNQHQVIRDYAIQHLSMLSERFDEPAGLDLEQVRSQRELIQDVLWEAAEAKQSSIAGTAMLGLARMSETDALVDVGRLREKAFQVASDASSQEAARITALQLCGRLQLNGCTALLTELAKNEPKLIVRISAIGALGLVGGKTEMELLEQINQSGDKRLSPVAAVAIQRIQERGGQL